MRGVASWKAGPAWDSWVRGCRENRGQGADMEFYFGLADAEKRRVPL